MKHYLLICWALLIPTLLPTAHADNGVAEVDRAPSISAEQLPAAADRPYDPAFKEIEDKIDAATKQHCATQHILDRPACMREIRERYTTIGDIRGTAEYVDKHYLPLATDALDKKWKELKVLVKQARAFRPAGPKYHGELVVSVLRFESDRIENELAKRQKTDQEQRLRDVLQGK